VPGAIRLRREGDRDVFVAAFDTRSLVQTFGTYLGGGGFENAPVVGALPDGSAWIAAGTTSMDFPVLHPVHAFQPGQVGTDLGLAHIRAGDPRVRPEAPFGLQAESNGIRRVDLRWSAVAGATGIVVDRRELGAFIRRTILAGDATAWTDTEVLPDHGYTYSLQALNDAGGSPSSERRVLTEASLLLDTIDGRFKSSSGSLALRGAVRARASEPPSVPRANGFVLVSFTRLGAQTILSIPAGDQLWRETGRHLRWRFGSTRLDLDPRTGRFFLQGRPQSFSPVPSDAFTLQVNSGDEFGSTTTFWRRVSRTQLRTP
jgi:hypothetical protein